MLYTSLGAGLTDEERCVQRQALAGFLWSKQFYHYEIAQWLDGDHPHLPRGCVARAWSVAEVLRVWRFLEQGK